MHAYWVPNQSAQCPLNTTVYICGNIVKKFIKMLSLWRIMSRWQFGKFPSSIYKVMSMMGLAWCLRYLQLIECNVKCAEAINDQIFSWSSLNKEKFPSKKKHQGTDLCWIKHFVIVCLSRAISWRSGHIVLDSISSSSCEKSFWVNQPVQPQYPVINCDNCRQDVIAQSCKSVTWF